ncbi:hypothetical protein GH714_001571 [Hevea brasiliensis]|uniref:Uncharacterized protein n=1 Tax=Hevea brasiliensis TaxID=3981 RepID=A0A6A6KY05_HEVBR|nr:hypothetical protein GH714_001571 [Hevea brasiliensis]
MAFSGKPVTPNVVVDETWICDWSSLTTTLNETVEMILNLVNGAKTYPNAYYRSIDVRDVAVAHVQALEIPSASGRYCLAADDLHFSELLKIIHEHCSSLKSD